MINKLRNKGMIIDDDKLAIELLKSVGYYGLVNKYKSEFYIQGKKEYQENVHLIDLYYYHTIEDELRNILFQSIIHLEQRFKESMAYIIAKELGVKRTDYLIPNKYRRVNKAKKIITFLNETIEKCQDNPTKYYKNEYNDLPPWIMLSNLSFGQARMLFSIFRFNWSKYVTIQLLNLNERKQVFLHETIDNQEFVLIEFTRNIISIAYQFRNNLAHGNRLIHYHSKESLKINGLRLFANVQVLSNEEYYSNNLCHNDLFALMVSLVIVLDKRDSAFFINQLNLWQNSNFSNTKKDKQFNKFINSCELPVDFVKRLANLI